MPAGGSKAAVALVVTLEFGVLKKRKARCVWKSFAFLPEETKSRASQHGSGHCSIIHS